MSRKSKSTRLPGESSPSIGLPFLGGPTCERSAAATSPPATPSLAGSPAKTSASPVEETACQGSGLGFGLSTCGWCRRCDPDGYSLRMFLRCALEASTPCSAVWSKRDTPLGRSWWVLAKSERPTRELEFSSLQDWPTPQARDWKDTGPSQGNRKDPKLGTQVHWTATQAQGMWPTPTAQDAASSGSAGYSKASGRHGGTTLTDATVGPRGPASRSTNGKNRARLNHRWVAQLMGFPLDWSDVRINSDEPA